MCGIVGFVQRDLSADKWIDSLQKMSQCLAHRGPDDQGIWYDVQSNIGLSHRRLSIVDLSVEGHQPMISADGRFILTYNGEIYNHLVLREILFDRGYRFRGSSDTEIMLAAFSEWGIQKAVKKFIGMFAFALWDKQEQILYLARDRMGEKPLYYGWNNNIFLFASELKAMTQHPSWQKFINRSAVTLLLRHNYIPAPYTIYENICKLLPGSFLKINVQNFNPSTPLQSTTYWSAKVATESNKKQPFLGSAAEAINTLESLLKETVAEQMIADVPLGAFLSGGIDSSLIVALMQTQSLQAVKTFTIGFDENTYNEAPFAKAIATYLKTDHTELYISPKQAMDIIPKIPSVYDEPFSDSSQIPTLLVSQLAREYVTVSLSGDGGDELFGGYNRYFWGHYIWQRLKYFPPRSRQLIAKLVLSIAPHSWAHVFDILTPFLPRSLQQRMLGYKMYRFADIFGVGSPEEMYKRLVSHWEFPETIVLNASEPETNLTQTDLWPCLRNFTEQMMFLDMISYLPDDILTKVDRAAMSVGLESRIPFLDQRIVEFAWQIPLDMKIHKNQGKWILRQILYKYVPKELIERPKVGFGIPIDKWLRGPLRDWSESLLSETRLHKEGFFNPKPIRQKWNDHLNGKGNWHYWLWDILMFQAWLEHWH